MVKRFVDVRKNRVADPDKRFCRVKTHQRSFPREKVICLTKIGGFLYEGDVVKEELRRSLGRSSWSWRKRGWSRRAKKKEARGSP